MSDPQWRHRPQVPGPLPPYPYLWAPYGRDPVSGRPYSDKSKVIAALLQLLGLFGLLGFGRIYLGHVGLGIAQLVIGLLATVATYGFGIFVPFTWGLVEAILIMSGRVYDKQYRPLRGIA